jgi:SAM-dependent methyltransferase
VELLFIRWLDAQVRPLAFVKNLPLIASFLGLGLGYGSPDRPRRFVRAAGLLLAAVIVAGLASDMAGGGTVAFGPVGAEVNVGARQMEGWLELLVFVFAITGAFVLVTLAAFPFGQAAARSMRGTAPLPAYTANLVGSLAGVGAAFVLASLAAPLWLNAALAFLATAWVVVETKKAKFATLAAGILSCAAMVAQDHPGTGAFRVWSPYNKIEVRDTTPARRPGQPAPRPEFSVYVQSLYHQAMFAASPEKWPALQRAEDAASSHYDFPYRLIRPKRVLILGAGTGNDAAAALRNGAESVDAVEIDPEILSIGKALHPDEPYRDPRVRAIVDDARAFLQRPGPSYDLIVFGTLDAHLGFYSSVASSIRLDNYVYTVESFRSALSHLSPAGAVYAFIYIERPWVASRLASMIEEAWGRPPLMKPLASTTSGAAYLFGPGALRLGSAPGLRTGLPAEERLLHPPGPLATDDWPFLYLRSRSVPPVLLGSALLVLLAAALLSRRLLGGALALNRHFFFLGTGFLLVETRTIAQLALLFGTTWRVSAIAIGAILAAALLANALVSRIGPLKTPALYAGLGASLVAGYFAPMKLFLGAGTGAAIAAVALLALPVVFSSLVFASSVSRVANLAPVLASNLIGGVLGGVLENLSLVVGISALGLVAVAVYACSIPGSGPPEKTGLVDAG